MRTFCPKIRDWKMKVSINKEESEFLEFDRPLNCATGPMKCCCYQEVIAKGSDGINYGSIKEQFYWCIPTFFINNSEGVATHSIHPPTCCGGLCVDCCKEGFCNCRIPFYIYPASDRKGEFLDQEDGKIVKVWAGITSELFTDSDNFELIYPQKSDYATKVTLLGAVFLINQAFFEGKDN